MLHSSSRKISQSNIRQQQQQKQFILTNKRIKAAQITNNNLKKKLSLYQPNKDIILQPQFIKNRIKKSLQSNKEKSHTQKKQKKQLIDTNEILSINQKFTEHQKSVINLYKQEILSKMSNKMNTFELALLQMIQKEQEIILKKQEQLKFWRNKANSLEEQYLKIK